MNLPQSWKQIFINGSHYDYEIHYISDMISILITIDKINNIRTNRNLFKAELEFFLTNVRICYISDGYHIKEYNLQFI